MEFRILGPLEIWAGDGSLPIGGPKQRAVIAHLILRANRVVPAEQLIDELWGEEPPDTARNTLQTYVYRLRKVLGEDRIEGTPGGYVLHARPEEIDAERFEALVREGRGLLEHDPASALARFDEALALWRGPPFSDFAGEPSLRGEIARLEDLQLAATEHRVSAQLALGRHTTVIGSLEALTGRYPLRERLWAGLMLALYRNGRQADALDAYRRAREVLSDELGIDPSPELRELHERILRQDPELVASAPTSHLTARPVAGELAPGTVFAGYRIDSVLGRGGMSVVYLAHHLGLERKVALKVLAPQLSEDERFRERFVRESRIAAGMEHSNIVPIYEAGEADGLLFLAMRYVPGSDLNTLIRREGSLDPARSAWIVREVASALDAAHARGLVHRDVKPGNILVVEGEGSEGNDLVYLSDFGLTKRLEGGTGGLTQTGQFVGTVDYVAPEQIESKPVDGRADVYSLGCVLYECLTGRAPYERETQVAALFAHLQERPPRLTASRPELPTAVDGVVAKALSKSPAARHASSGALAADLRQALGPLAGDMDRPRSGWPRWQAAAGAVAAALVAGVIVFSISRGETPAASGSGGSPSPVASPSPAPEPNFATVDRPLSGDEERLLSYIPQEVAADCLPFDRQPQQELAALVCADGGTEVLYELFDNRDAMNAAFQLQANISEAPEGECATDEEAVGAYTIDDVPAGRVLCYRMETREGLLVAQPESSSHLHWTDERIFVYAHAIRNDAGDLTLYEWWLSSSGPVVSGGDPEKDRPPASARSPLRDGAYLVSPPRGCAEDKVGGNTCALYIKGPEYTMVFTEYPGDIGTESGTILVQKPNAVVFAPRTGYCFLGNVLGETRTPRPAVYEWRANGDTVSFERTGGGQCAGPQGLSDGPWTRAPVGTIALEQQGELTLLDAGGSLVERLAIEAPTRPNASPAWSPDGSRIVFAGAGEDVDLYVVNADGTGLTRLTEEVGDEVHPAWSPDGSQIAFAFNDLGFPPDVFRTSIVVMNADGTDWTELVTRENELLGWPSWSPDGSRIAFSATSKNDGFDLYVMDADGGRLTKVREEPPGLFAVPMTWTPDGERIVFWGVERGKETLLSMRPNGSDVRELAPDLPEGSGALEVAWSPDGRWIVAAGVWDEAAVTGEPSRAYLIRGDGSEVFVIAPNATEPSWRPEG